MLVNYLLQINWKKTQDWLRIDIINKTATFGVNFLRELLLQILLLEDLFYGVLYPHMPIKAYPICKKFKPLALEGIEFNFLAITSKWSTHKIQA
ncbi:unnamed protein product [Blepharisma stoltei]|uniref:Uncharacterized protein n=1 Tax=Blepharisma stoltei TaxID=1481888 RepID=A0AAU9IBT3_9CILI|nr:unnamed protein product [Blepharisma stoltei]